MTDYETRRLENIKRNQALIKELGIKAVFVGDKKGHSTSKLIQAINKRKKK